MRENAIEEDVSEAFMESRIDILIKNVWRVLYYVCVCVYLCLSLLCDYVSVGASVF